MNIKHSCTVNMFIGSSGKQYSLLCLMFIIINLCRFLCLFVSNKYTFEDQTTKTIRQKRLLVQNCISQIRKVFVVVEK